MQRKAKGRKVGGKCRAQARADRERKACTRWVRLNGSFSVDAAAGESTVPFSGRIGTRALRPGRYRLSARATDAAGNASVTVRASIRIRR